RQRVYKLEDERHNVTDRRKALEKAFEWGDRIPIGIFYQEKRPTYRDNLPQIKDDPLTKLTTEDIDIIPLLRRMK
ncbi:2-oxoacid ferredoxin oxidoreductase, partial [Candidatus Bathyarchaeota archaeon]|nr:2-oxoacid ferredoxin oxidoreductase [Candidatus Bathyarchaeota archaeon]